MHDITNDRCPWYKGSMGYRIWKEELLRLAIVMHPTYIPINKDGQPIWS